jgi:hypothetical protein
MEQNAAALEIIARHIRAFFWWAFGIGLALLLAIALALFLPG